MPDRDQYYSVNAWGDTLTTGETLKIVHSLWFSEYNAAPHLAPLVVRPVGELTKMLDGSRKQEEAIFKKLQQETSEWEKQAAYTLLLEKALEYVRTPEVEHTSNEWKKMRDGTWEISNRVYKMRYRFDPVPQSEAVRVTWGIIYNVPQQPGDPKFRSWGDSINIVEQNKKLYDDVETAQRYIQGRFDLYSHLFTELSPPVPHKCRRFFSVNGHLCPGYTLAPPERTSAKDIDALLDCLEDEDLPVLEQKMSSAPPPQKAGRSASQKRPSRKKTAPVR